MLCKLLARVASTTIVLLTVTAVALGAPLPAANAQSTPILTQGSGLGAAPSASVRRVQRILDRRGFALGRPGVDGRFGPITAAAVRRMQARYGLEPDGIVGPKTRRLLNLIDEATPARRPRAQSQSRKPPTTQQQSPPTPRQTTPTTPTTSQPQTTASPPAATAPGTTAPASRPAGATDNADTTPAFILAAVAALLAGAALAVALVRTRSRRPTGGTPGLTAIDRDLYLEGDSERPEVGAFRGFALATAVVPDAADDPHRMRYLIDDPRKPAPVWVNADEISRSPSHLAAGETVIGYVTADPDANREQDAFMEIEAACEHARWKLDEIVRDKDTGRIVGRPELMRALERIAAGEARGLVVTDTHSLVRGIADLGALLEWFRDAEATLIALDLDLDTATIHGHQTASTLIAVSGWEEDRTSTRARRGLARVQTPARAGEQGPESRAVLVDRIHAMREAGMSLQAIADQLTNEAVPSFRGGTTWSQSAVRAALNRAPRRRSIRDELPAIPTHERQG
jgi:DNA invertase Pin-like site-specific DNA recombinase